MTERLCAWSEDDIPSRGKISDAYIQLYHEWGIGGFGVIVRLTRMVRADPRRSWAT